MGQSKPINVGIVGGGPGCKAIMDMIFAEKLNQLEMKLVGVACTNPNAVGFRYALEKGIYTATVYEALYRLNDLDMIIELTGRKEVADAIDRTKPGHVRLMDHVEARLFWDVFRIEEERIEERKRAEKTLQAAEQEKDAILGSLIEHVTHQDPALRILWANRAACESVGLTLEQVVGRHCYEIWAQRKEICPDCPVSIAMKTGRPEVIEKWTPDGRAWYVRGYPLYDDHGKLVGAVEVTLDITKRKRAEKALRESEAKYRHLFDMESDAIFLIDNEEGRILEANASAELLYGYSRAQLLEKKNTDLSAEPESTRAAVLELRSRVPVRYHRKKDGSIFPVEIAARHFAWQGREVHVAGIRDISSRMESEERTLKLQSQLQQAQKLESLGTLAGGIAHDFNNLLMGIQGQVSLMLMDRDPADSDFNRLKSLEQQIESGARLTSLLLGYARKGRYHVKPVDLNHLVEEACETFGRTKKQITIHQELDHGLHTAELDRGQIEQVFFNLCVNAADAMPDGGHLTVKTMNVNHDSMKDKLYKPKSGDYILLSVTDTGTGMDTKTMERIFDPFFTTKEMGHGTGLGLASAYGIIKAHGGYIDVDSTPGNGSTFRIYLPASDKTARETGAQETGIVRGGETVLLVDDEETVRQVSREMMEALGYKVIPAGSGKEAVAVYRLNQDSIDMVLLDMVMPDMGGGEAYDQLKEINPQLKVLLLSGFSVDGQATEILQRGCDGFIQKPFNMEALSGKIREILDG